MCQAVNNKKNLLDVYCKHDIMMMFKCESDKALKILKILYQMKLANKIGNNQTKKTKGHL